MAAAPCRRSPSRWCLMPWSSARPRCRPSSRAPAWQARRGRRAAAARSKTPAGGRNCCSFSASPEARSAVLLLLSGLPSPVSPVFFPSSLPANGGAAKEIEDRRVGLNKKQKLEEGTAAAATAAGNAGAAATAASGSAAAAGPAGGDTDMKDAEGGSSAAAAKPEEDPAAFAGQLTGAQAGSWSLPRREPQHSFPTPRRTSPAPKHLL